MTVTLLWLAILLQALGAVCGFMLGSPIGNGAAVLCAVLGLFLTATALRP